MKQLIFSIIFLLTYLVSYAQPSSFPDKPYTGLHYVVSEGSSIVAVGSCDKAMYSHDNGTSWNYMDIDVDVYGIDLITGTNGREIFLYNRDELLRLDTNAESIVSTGVTSNSLISGRFEGMHTVEDRIVLVGSVSVFVADVSSLVFSKVGDLDYGSSDQIRYTSLSDDYIWIGTKEGLVFKGDLINNSMSLIYDFESEIRNLAFGTDDVGYASLSGQSALYKTIDGGATWSTLNTFSEIATLYAEGEDIVISRNTNRLVVSTDGGATSEYISYDSDSDHSYLADLYVSDNETMYMVGESSTVLKSLDFGLTYENLNPYSREPFNYIDINEEGLGIAVGDKSKIITTDDNGQSWEEFSYVAENPNHYFSGCLVTNDGSRFVFGDDGVLEVVDNMTIKLSEESLVNVMYISGDDSFVGVKYQGGSHIVKRSTDGGVTWESKAVLNNYGYYQAHNDNGTIVISMDDLEFAISLDYGENWEIKDNPLANSMSGICLFGESLGLVASGYSLYKTTDGFNTFEEVSYGYGQNNAQIYSDDHFVFTSAQNFVTTVKESKDGGETWSVVDNYCSLTLDAILVGDTYWMGQRGGHINFTKLDLTSSLDDRGIVSPLTINSNIVQNGDALVLELDYPIYGDVEMIDRSGNRVSQFQIRNERSIQIMTNDLRSGVYFIRINSGDELLQGEIVIVD